MVHTGHGTAVLAVNYRRKDGSMVDEVRHLSPAQLADRLGVPLETVYGWNKLGTGPRYLKVGRHVRYRLADVLGWEESRAVTSAAGA